MNQDFNAEDLISGATGPMKFVLAVMPLLTGGFAITETVHAYLFPDAVERAKNVVWFFGLFLAVGAVSLFIWPKLMDQAYAQAGLLSLRKGTRLVTVSYGDIRAMGVFRGRYGPLAWLRIKTASGRSRLVFFIASDNYATSWPSRTATRFLWKKLNEPLD